VGRSAWVICRYAISVIRAPLVIPRSSEQTGDSFEYAIASDVAANPALVPLVDLQAPVIDPSTLDSTVTSDLMTQAGIL